MRGQNEFRFYPQVNYLQLAAPGASAEPSDGPFEIVSPSLVLIVKPGAIVKAGLGEKEVSLVEVWATYNGERAFVDGVTIPFLVDPNRRVPAKMPGILVAWEGPDDAEILRQVERLDSAHGPLPRKYVGRRAAAFLARQEVA